MKYVNSTAVWGFQTKIISFDHWRKRGYSKEGLELDLTNLVPEVTVNVDGVFWHPLSTDEDMQISRTIFPLSNSVEKIQKQLESIALTGSSVMTTFT